MALVQYFRILLYSQFDITFRRKAKAIFPRRRTTLIEIHLWKFSLNTRPTVSQLIPVNFPPFSWRITFNSQLFPHRLLPSLLVSPCLHFCPTHLILPNHSSVNWRQETMGPINTMSFKVQRVCYGQNIHHSMDDTKVAFILHVCVITFHSIHMVLFKIQGGSNMTETICV